jgi:hypothetical protein
MPDTGPAIFIRPLGYMSRDADDTPDDDDFIEPDDEPINPACDDDQQEN